MNPAPGTSLKAAARELEGVEDAGDVFRGGVGLSGPDVLILERNQESSRAAEKQPLLHHVRALGGGKAKPPLLGIKPLEPGATLSAGPRHSSPPQARHQPQPWAWPC